MILVGVQAAKNGKTATTPTRDKDAHLDTAHMGIDKRFGCVE